jgi:hypothetical protein
MSGTSHRAARLPNCFAQNASPPAACQGCVSEKEKSAQFDSKNLIALFLAELRCRIC